MYTNFQKNLNFKHKIIKKKKKKKKKKNILFSIK